MVYDLNFDLIFLPKYNFEPVRVLDHMLARHLNVLLAVMYSKSLIDLLSIHVQKSGAYKLLYNKCERTLQWNYLTNLLVK